MDEHADKKLAHVQETIEQFEDSNDYQRGCTAEATKLWQQAHNQPDTLPDIGVLINWLALEIENKQYTITCAVHEIADLRELLDEARAEIERLKEYTTCTLVTVDSEMDDKDIAIIKRDELIEQMRDALQMVRATSKSFLPGLTWQAVIAALEAAERGE